MLEIEPAALEAIRTKHRDDLLEQCRQVFRIWRDRGTLNRYNFTWNGILNMLNDIEMESLAKKLETALNNRILTT